VSLFRVKTLYVAAAALWLTIAAVSFADEPIDYAKPDRTVASAPRAYFDWFEYVGHEKGAASLRWRDDFDSAAFRSEWLSAQDPKPLWADLATRPGWLTLHALRMPLESPQNTSFLAQRQRYHAFDASTLLETPPAHGLSAGLAVFLNESNWYFLGVHRHSGASTAPRQLPLELFLEKRSGTKTEIVVRRDINNSDTLELKITATPRGYSFYFDDDASGWKPLAENDAGAMPSTAAAGNFAGALIGPYARAE
jgi:xylan 1,4-beta-xylosidase